VAPEIGAKAPPFNLPNQDKERVSLESLLGDGAVMIVFIPFPFTTTCDAEVCTIRDNFDALDARVVVINCHAAQTNKRWVEEYGLGFEVLSDFWPHGEVARAYGTFNEERGMSERHTFVLDSDGTVRDIIKAEGRARELDAYVESLSSLHV